MNVERKHRIAPLARLGALLVLAFAIVQPAFAQGELGVAADGGRVSASATVTFKIVVREAVRMDARHLAGEVASRDRRSPPEQRQVDAFDGLQRVTLARP